MGRGKKNAIKIDEVLGRCCSSDDNGLQCAKASVGVEGCADGFADEFCGSLCVVGCDFLFADYGD
ncbi:hypothetical protein SDC9_94130 [bioreactor metagenome]|uniref:Uncharacterized protein n=1 Tax=bioreactor metagenome TaxID=1076179 RepID=A0A645A2K1_9ZZZZ